MKDYNEIIEEQQNNLNRIKAEKDESIRDKESREFQLKIASQLLSFLREETLKAEVTNQKDYSVALKRVEDAVRAIPKTEKVSVKNLESVIRGLDELKGSIKGIKFPDIPKTVVPDNKKELLSIEKAVKGIKIPEVKIPDFPKIPEVDFSVLVKEIKKLEKALEVGSTNSDKKTQQRASELVSELNGGLATLAESLKRIEEKEYPQPEDRTDDILKGLKTVSETIQNIRFPVPHVPTQNIVDAINNMNVGGGGFSADADITTTINGDIITQTDGVKTLTTTVSGNTITEEWS
jgi:hypothetical protein